MTDTNEDRLEEIKKRYELKWDLVFACFNVNDFQWVIDEVERLRGYEIEFNEGDAYRKLVAQIDSLTKELESVKAEREMAEEVAAERGMELEAVKKERDELSNRVDHLTKTGYEDVTKMGRILDDVRKIKKLEAENEKCNDDFFKTSEKLKKALVEIKELKQKLAEVEGKVKELEADLPAICDVPECDAVVACGTPTKAGYRNTCSFHKPDRSE